MRFICSFLYGTPTAVGSSLVLYNKREQVEVGRWIAPESSQLGNMTLLNSGTEVWIADQQNNRLFVLEVQIDDIAESLYTEIPTLGPITDVSTLSTENYTHVYVASDQRVDVWDVNAEKMGGTSTHWILIVGVLISTLPLSGLSSSQRTIDLQTTSAWLAPKQDHVVVPLYNGSTVMIEGETGCIATVPEGSSLSLDGTAYGEMQFNDSGPPSNPQSLCFQRMEQC